ncbi:phosphotransferase family protein [Sphingomonas sp. 8AM]|uniref:phosphotransferase family protein n=1 Tax=Sphingomonas sp. 8AM TaxID=2653170 RepID=UPI0012F1FBEE|nr:phosphotransferase family protein [Sphingomonas sp. 8AM]VXC92283.1 Aminoglycoside phosphotransferase [Sphingomonas sp. 8AM]
MTDLDTARLGEWLAVHVPGAGAITREQRLEGGQSNPTYRIDTDSGSYVLRRKPVGALLPSAHQVDREYRVIAALHPTGFPVPRPYGLCMDDAVIGSAFYVMAMVEGRTIWDGTMPDLTLDQRRAHYEAMIDTLADLHNTDHVAIGLDDYGRPGNYFERQVARWTKQYRGAETEPMPAMEKLIDFLPRTVPAQERTSIVHGDYRVDNLRFAPGTEPRVWAVLDWELSTLGDPVADLTYFLMSWVTEPEGRSGVLGRTGAATGIPEMAKMLERYCARTGRSAPIALDWYFAFNLFRLAGIVQGIKKRIVTGTAANPRAHETAARMGGLVDAAWHFAQRAGA